MERSLSFTEGEFYHIYNRGIDKNRIFFSPGDWKHFQRLLFLRNGDKYVKPNRVQGVPLDTIDRGDSLVDICAYAMMPNHFHLILFEKQEGGISKFMLQFMTSYSMYMNKKYDRTGPLMCRPFRSKHVDSDEYFRWLISYIHLNPIDLVEKDWKEGGVSDLKLAQKHVNTYEYSSYMDYFIESRDLSAILNKKSLPIDVQDLESVTNMISVPNLS